MASVLGLLLLPAAMHPAEPTPRPAWEPPGLFITVYDWGLGGQNCDYIDGAPECAHTALTATGDELLGWVAACPSAWLGHISTTVVTIWGADVWCVDAFGRPEHRVLTEIDGHPVYRIDLAFRPAADHSWNQERVPAGDWSVEWRPMAEFYTLREQRAAQLAGQAQAAESGGKPAVAQEAGIDPQPDVAQETSDR